MCEGYRGGDEGGDEDGRGKGVGEEDEIKQEGGGEFDGGLG